jgi:DNA-binding SARP family transcriptional activator
MTDVTTLFSVELGVLGPLQVRQDGAPVAIPGAKPRAILTMLGLHGGSVVSADALVELLWGDDPPRTAGKALQTHISSLRRALGDGFVLTQGSGWTANATEIDASRYKLAGKMGRDAAAAGDTSQAVAHFEEALTLWRGVPELPDTQRGASEKTRWIEGHAALVEDRADALLATGRAAEIIGELEAAVAEAPLRERRWGQLMLALYRAGRQGEALGTYQRARSMLANELGVDPGPNLRRLEAAIVGQDAVLDVSVAPQISAVTRAVTFLLTDIEGSTAAWEADADAMAVALARHDELVEQVVTSRGGRVIKTRGEGDATFSVFDRPSAAAAAAIELQDAISHEPWALREPMRIRVALHTGEVEFRDGDYFGRAVNRAARLRSLATGGQILCSGATAELVIDSLSDDVVLADLGMRQLRNLARPEHVFELRLETADDVPQPETSDAPMERPAFPAVLTGPGPFVGRGQELERLLSTWQTAVAEGVRTVLIAGEPGVGKTRLAGEWSRQAYEQGAVVLYGRCDEDLGAPYQPFAEALRSLVPCLGTDRLRGLRGVEALLALAPGLTDVLPDVAAPTRADPDTERYALFDAVVALLEAASTSAPVVLILDDLHWAAKPTLLLMRHLLRFGERARVQIVGTYRSTDLDRSHPLAAMLADLHRDGTVNRLQLSGLDEDDVTTYVAEAGYDDEELARALASVTGGNPFFLIEALRHVDESGGVWDPTTLPQGVRETVSRRLSRLPAQANKALAAAAVVGSRFALDLVERVVDQDLVDAFDEACKAGIVIEEPGGRYRFNHALVRQSLLAELPSVRRMRLHQRIATTLESQSGADDELLAELAHHYFECAWSGNAAKAVHYCRRAAEQAMARLAYEGAADLYDRALHALEEIDEELPDREDQVTELLVARCEALLAAGDVTSAAGAVSQLQGATHDSVRLAAWATCFDGQLSMLVHPERLDEVEAAVGAAASSLAALDDAAGEAKAHTVRAGCLARLGRIADCETALDDALTAARRARDHRRVNAVLANAPLAALWGPNPVPRAGGRCLDVVRLLRITTDSPAVEATSTRCQAVLEAFRGRAEAARRMIDSARRTVTELGLRHALLEVEQFAGIVELVVDDAAAAEPHWRKAYNGFRRMGLDADTAETAALLGRACLALGREAEADELCSESERLAGHALKASIAWRALRAKLLARRNDHQEARRVAEAAVTVAERTDALVDHGDACLTLATVLGAAGNAEGARAAAERAVDLYERKGAAALADKARRVLGEPVQPSTPAEPEAPQVELDNACVRVCQRLVAAIDREDWDEFERLFAPEGSVESRRTIVGFTQTDLPSGEFSHAQRRILETGDLRFDYAVIAVRGERLALTRLQLRTKDVTPGAPQDELLQLYGLDQEGRIALQMWWDIDDMDAAIAELDAVQARFEEGDPGARRLENAASQVAERYLAQFAARNWDAMAELLTDDFSNDDRRRVVGASMQHGRDASINDMRAIADLWTTTVFSTVIATRGERLTLMRFGFSDSNQGSDAFISDILGVAEITAHERVAAFVAFDADDIDAAFGELDARYVAGEAAPYSDTWSVVAGVFAAHNRREVPAATPDAATVDHRRVAAFAPGEGLEYIRAGWDLEQNLHIYIETVHRVSDLGAVFTWFGHGTSQEGFAAEWRGVNLITVDREMVDRCEIFDEEDVDAAIARFEQLSEPAPRLENAASRVAAGFEACFGARDWDAMAAMLADDIHSEDRRRVVNAELQQGRDALIKNFQAATDLGVAPALSDALATRGERLVLTRSYYSRGDHEPGSFQLDLLHVVEIDDHERIATLVTFDLDDLDAAFAELDARYLAGEAAPHARTWSVITDGYAALNRHELPATTPNCVSIDHRRGTAFAPGELVAYIQASLDVDHEIRIFAEVVHRLNDLGAVVTHMARVTSSEGFDAEWREVALFTVDGVLVNRFELFGEADLDTAIAEFDQLSRPTPRLENAASRAAEHYVTHFAARDWDALAKVLAEDIVYDDRRRVVNAGIRHGRDAEIESVRAAADAGLGTHVTSVVIAARGERLILARVSSREPGPEEFDTDVLSIAEVNSDNQIAAIVVFDIDDFDAAIAELDARYLAGEAAAHSQTWSVVARTYAALNRHELPPTTADIVSIDHRRGATAFAPGDLLAYVRANFELQDICTYVEAVHRLTDVGAVVTHVGTAASREGFNAEWRLIAVATIEGNLPNRAEFFDESDLDAAVARFEELHRPSRRLENAASQVDQRFWAYFPARDWDAMAEILSDDFSLDDRRQSVNAGIRQGRDAEIANLKVLADVGAVNTTSNAIATRGERLALRRLRFAEEDQGPEAFLTELLGIVEINAANQLSAHVVFDPDDVDAAFAELESRYLAGEAAAHAHTWSLIGGAFAAINRHELPELAPDWANIDHRRAAAFAPGEMATYTVALWDQAPDVRVCIEAVHRLSDLGAVVSQAAKGTSQQGFEAEWREIGLFTFEGDVLNRCELFDEADIDAALARFEELHPQARRLENAASLMYDRYNAYLAARDWDAMAEMIAEDACNDDRRRVVSAGVRRGRDAVIEELRAVVDLGVKNIESVVIATRGDRLALMRTRASGGDKRPEAFRVELLNIVEIDTDNRIAAGVMFDIDDIDVAFEELETRYLAGEAAAHSQTWSVITRTYAGFNRNEFPATDQVIDHRRGTPFVSSDLTAAIRGFWDLTPEFRIHIETVHRLSKFAAVVTHASYGTSREGFDAEWRMIQLLSVEGDRVNRCELFDEEDIDAALARFEELHPQMPRPLENAASQVYERCNACFAARDWSAMAETFADDISTDDRRRVVGAGIRHGREALAEITRAIVDLGLNHLTSNVIATRGARLILTRTHFSGPDRASGAFFTDILSVVEINANNRIAANVVFDPGDRDTAFEELDARYLAGEAAAHAHTWSVVARAYAVLNRHELPAATPDWVNIDRRRLAMIEAGDLTASIRAAWDLSPDSGIYIESVHRLSKLGAVLIWAGHGTSQEGFEAESRGISILTVEGELIDRCELFDETDLDAAIARFEELHPQAARLENAASRVDERFHACFAARDWAAMGEILADDISADDRRRVVNAGIRRGRDAKIADMRATADLGTKNGTSTVIAIRGQRLALTRIRLSGRDQRPDAFHTEMLGITEINADNRMAARILFDPDDSEAAFEELDARYLAGEAAVYSHTWSLIADTSTAFNRREVFPTTPDWVNIDHRRAAAFASGEMSAYIHAIWHDAPDSKVYIEAVHRLNHLGAVVTEAARGTSQQGFQAEWRLIGVATVDGGLINRCEMFDEADLDTALARFEELQPKPPRLENAASRQGERFFACFGGGEWDAMAEILSDTCFFDDRRHVVNAGLWIGCDVVIANMRVLAEVTANITLTVIATRGERLALTRVCGSNRDLRHGEFRVELLSIIEVDADNQIAAHVAFDPNDIDAAFKELDARYLAGDAASHADAWSVIVRNSAAFNRRELFATTPNWVNIDHRRGIAFAPGQMTAYLRVTQDVTPEVNIYVEAVHRLTGLGAVVSHAAHGTSTDGFAAEWRVINLLMVEDDLINRAELFDEADLEAAVAKFDELTRTVPRLENAASRVVERFLENFAARDWDAIAEIVADDISSDDRRPVVNAGIRHGRDAEIEEWRAAADVGVAPIESTVIATRGQRLALGRFLLSVGDERPDAFYGEVLGVVEIDADNRITARVVFDLDDIDAAFDELDARYLAGEAAAHAHTWSVIAGLFTALNRRELPTTTPGWVNIDHRRATAFAPGEAIASLRATWDLTPDFSIHIEAVHLLNNVGAVVALSADGTSHEGFDAEWREIAIVTVDGDLINRGEIFDEADLDAALARFDELSRPAPLR